ncbi:MAG: flagellar motor protein MotB, partial [Pseudomonadales bacterium]|nr:flagellar motor protein MotB [Pseudomonadales bacterium]
MEFEDGERPIIVRKVIKKGHAHHGGAWKVAFADFAVAMMAFFMVLWLMEAATVKEKQAISGYFNDPTGFTEGGSPYVINLEGSLNDTNSSDDGGKQDTVSKEELEERRIVLNEDTVQDLAQQIETNKFKQLQSTLEARISENPDLEKYKDQIIMEITDDGLQIQIVDKDSRPMFDSGSNQIKHYTTNILEELAATIGTLKNKISVSGHTDAAIFTDRKDYSNWELSSERANSARRSLVKGGITEEKIAQVVGLSSSVLFDQNDPLNPTNRRISILVLNDRSAEPV